MDPSPVGDATVTYVASRGHLDASLCGSDSGCMLNVVERVNLTTGSVTRLYTRYNTNQGSTQIHDVDRVNESVLLVGDIVFPDGVYMVNTTTDEVIWRWNASQAYDPSSGGRYPNDWTHLNDVAYLEDGRVMANLRNQDQVVFIEPGEGVMENWTLGEDDDHGILYEQHNPDYIPAENGGPALLVADSENNRIVEYQRVNGNWTLSWLWSDPRLEWPRDADRLPNGNTLIVDSHGERIFEVNESGAVVAQRSFPNGGYDAERLGTGPESTGGASTFALHYLNGSEWAATGESNSPGGSNSTGGSTGTNGTDVSNGTGASNGTDVSNSRGGSNGEAAPNGTFPADQAQPTVEPVVHRQGCSGFVNCLRGTFPDLYPALILHGALFVLPDWVTPFGGAAFLTQLLVLLVWGVVEVVVRRERLVALVR